MYHLYIIYTRGRSGSRKVTASSDRYGQYTL